MLYGAIKKSVGDATEGIGEFQDRFRRIVTQAEPGFRSPSGFPWDRRSSDAPAAATGEDSEPRQRYSEATATPQLDRVIRSTMVEVLDSFDLPKRRDIERIARNLERVADALDRLESKS